MREIGIEAWIEEQKEKDSVYFVHKIKRALT